MFIFGLKLVKKELSSCYIFFMLLLDLWKVENRYIHLILQYIVNVTRSNIVNTISDRISNIRWIRVLAQKL
jgi:hypothetical protein